MVMFMCFLCTAKSEGKEYVVFNVPNPYSGEKIVCPQCGQPVLIPPKCCGICLHSAELSDGIMLCCIHSREDKLERMPFNADGEGCKTFEAPQELLEQIKDYSAVMDDLESEMEQVEDDVDNEYDEAFEDDEKEDTSEYDDAFNDETVQDDSET